MKLIKCIFVIFLVNCNAYAASKYFTDGLLFFEKDQLEKAKFKFEQDIVFNPRNEKSYLYLSKIFNRQDKNELEEKNLNTVILLNPKNEDALYSLAKLRLKESDFSGSKKLLEKLLTFCESFCQKSLKLKTEVENSIKN
jgi:Tfp pilus assembly protein PilF